MKKDSEGVRRVLKIISILLVIPCVIFSIVGLAATVFNYFEGMFREEPVICLIVSLIGIPMALFLPRIIWFSSYTLIDWVLEGFRKDKGN